MNVRTTFYLLRVGSKNILPCLKKTGRLKIKQGKPDVKRMDVADGQFRSAKARASQLLYLKIFKAAPQRSFE